MPQVNLRQDVFDRIRSRFEYGDSWSDFLGRTMDELDANKSEFAKIEEELRKIKEQLGLFEDDGR